MVDDEKWLLYAVAFVVFFPLSALYCLGSWVIRKRRALTRS